MIDPEPASDWLQRHALRDPRIEPLGGDLSPRKYFRVRHGGAHSAILAGYPPGQEETYRRFVETTTLMQAAGVLVPEILLLDENRHWMLLEDLGKETLYDLRRPWTELEGFFRTATGDLQRIRRIPATVVAELNPTLDAGALWRELEQTFDTVLVPRGLVSDGGLRRHLEEALDGLCRHIGSENLVPCHRDFMARNLVPRGDAGLVVLDHQDLRLGPSRYDLASLLNDSLFPPESMEARLAGEALGSGEELAAYRRAAVQRTFKAAGTFGAFARRGFPRHLPLIPPTLSRGLDQLERLPEGEELARDLRRRWTKLLGGTLLDFDVVPTPSTLTDTRET
jgi:N-acetylmuramate 1-kinase